MKFAFSTASSASPAALAIIAKRYGFDGVELNFPTTVPVALDPVGVEIACLAGGRGAGAHVNENQARVQHIRSLIDLAATIGYPIVKITEDAISSGKGRADSGGALGDWLVPLADFAAERGVCLALDNTQSRRTARETWAILDRLNHPSVGCCLDALTAAQIGQSPQVLVPMLNSKIFYVQVSDVAELGERAVECNLGDGVVPIATTIARLRGIGYVGWICVRCAGSAEVSERKLSQAITMLRELNKPTEHPKAKAKVVR
jgi:sugar phosphate isomerase/epimerase